MRAEQYFPALADRRQGIQFSVPWYMDHMSGASGLGRLAPGTWARANSISIESQRTAQIIRHGHLMPWARGPAPRA